MNMTYECLIGSLMTDQLILIDYNNLDSKIDLLDILNNELFLPGTRELYKLSIGTYTCNLVVELPEYIDEKEESHIDISLENFVSLHTYAN